MMNMTLEKSIYNIEALKKAKEIVDKADGIKISDKKNTVIIGYSDDLLFKKFMNEALHQDLRLALIKKNFNMIKFMVTKAVTSAVGENRHK
jgi:hypothetical protein